MSKRSFLLIVAAVALVVVGALLGRGVPRLSGRTETAPIMISTAVPTPTIILTATPATIQVYVNGAVIAPDVYILPGDSRVKQAIEAAGGFREDAQASMINLAQPLADGVHVYVPDAGSESEIPVGVLSEPVQPASAGRSTSLGGLRININTAGTAELEELPGIGPVIAQKIVDYRAANGSFATIEAVMEVSGIGETKFKQIRDLITTGN